MALAKAEPAFRAMNAVLLGLSVDSLYAHLAWMRAIQASFGVEIRFPVVEDPSMEVGRAYGMLDEQATDAAAVRATYFIDPHGIVRGMTWYPMQVGRSIDEMLRMLAALQRTDDGAVLTPADWRPGGDVPLPPAQTLAAASAEDGADWFHRTRPDR